VAFAAPPPERIERWLQIGNHEEKKKRSEDYKTIESISTMSSHDEKPISRRIPISRLQAKIFPQYPSNVKEKSTKTTTIEKNLSVYFTGGSQTPLIIERKSRNHPNVSTMVATNPHPGFHPGGYPLVGGHPSPIITGKPPPDPLPGPIMGNFELKDDGEVGATKRLRSRSHRDAKTAGLPRHTWMKRSLKTVASTTSLDGSLKPSLSQPEMARSSSLSGNPPSLSNRLSMATSMSSSGENMAWRPLSLSGSMGEVSSPSTPPILGTPPSDVILMEEDGLPLLGVPSGTNLGEGSKGKGLFGPEANPQKEMQARVRSTKANQLRWGHLYLPALPDLYGEAPNWRSLTIPGSLPITTDQFPSRNEIQKKFLRVPYRVSLVPGENIYDDNTSQLLAELICQRYNQEYQLAHNVKREDESHTPSRTKSKKHRTMDKALQAHSYHYKFRDSLRDNSSNGKMTLRFSFRSEYQELSFDREQDTVAVTRYIPRSRNDPKFIAKGSVVIPYRCRIWSDLTGQFMLRQIQIKATHDEYNWNHTDQLLAGYHNEFRNTSKAKQLCIALLPSRGRSRSLTGLPPRLKRVLSGTPSDRPLRLNRVLSSTPSEEKEGSSCFADWIASVTNKSVGELKIRVMQKEESPEINEEAKRKSTIIFLRSRSDTTDVEFKDDSDNVFQWGLLQRKEWFQLEYETVYHPNMAYCISFSWLVLSGVRLSDWIASIRRRAKRCGLRIVSIPVDFQTETPALFSSPFYCPIEVPLPKLRTKHLKSVAKGLRISAIRKFFRDAAYKLIVDTLVGELGFVGVLGRKLWIHNTGVAKVSWSPVRNTFYWYNNYLFAAAEIRPNSRLLFRKLRKRLRSLKATQGALLQVYANVGFRISAQVESKLKSGEMKTSEMKVSVDSSANVAESVGEKDKTSSK